MRNTGRALGESFLFHGVLLGLMLLMIESISQPPKKMPIDLLLLEPFVTPSGTTPQRPKEETVKAVPRPPQKAAVAKPLAKIAAKVPVKHRTSPRQKISPQITEKTPSQSPDVEREPVTTQPSLITQNKPPASSPNPAGAERITAPQETGGSSHDTLHLRNYLSLIRTRIEHHKRYPLWARRHRLEGEVSVRFVVSPGGKVSAVSVTKSSGQDCLDDAAIEAIQDAAPMPSPPDGVLTKSTSMNLTIVFKLA